MTNLDSGRSTAINSSGPGSFLYHRNVTFARDADGNIVDFTATGTRSGNLCAAIA